MRRLHVRGHENVLKRLLIQVTSNLGSSSEPGCGKAIQSFVKGWPAVRGSSLVLADPQGLKACSTVSGFGPIAHGVSYPFAASTGGYHLSLRKRFHHGLLGINFVSFQENIDTSSPLGGVIFTIISAVAQLERDIIAERVKAGLRRSRERGKRLGRPKKKAPGLTWKRFTG